MTKLDAKEVKAPDVFITFSDKVIGWLEKYRRSVFGLIAGALVAGGVYVVYEYWQQHIERQAQEALYLIEEGSKENKDQLIIKYQDFIKDHKRTKASLIATVRLADIFRQNSKLNEAQSAIESALGQVSSESFFFGVLNIQLASVKMDLKDFNGGISHLEAIVAEPSQKHFHGESLLKIGLSYYGLSELEKAQQYFKRVIQEFKSSDAAEKATVYLRYLALKKG